MSCTRVLSPFSCGLVVTPKVALSSQAGIVPGVGVTTAEVYCVVCVVCVVLGPDGMLRYEKAQAVEAAETRISCVTVITVKQG